MSKPRTFSPPEHMLGDARDEFRLDDWLEHQAGAESLIRQARRHVDLFSPDLDPRVLNRPGLVDALSSFARGERHRRVRILTHDTRQAAQQGHVLVPLIQTLTTSIEVRVTPEEFHDSDGSAYLIADRVGVLYREQADLPEGKLSFNAPQQAKSLGTRFERLWEHSLPDQQLRRLMV